MHCTAKASAGSAIVPFRRAGHPCARRQDRLDRRMLDLALVRNRIELLAHARAPRPPARRRTAPAISAPAPPARRTGRGRAGRRCSAGRCPRIRRPRPGFTLACTNHSSILPRRALLRVGSRKGAPFRFPGKSFPYSGPPAPAPDHQHLALEQQVAEHASGAARLHFAVGQHHVQLVQGEVGQQGLELVFVADQAHLLVDASSPLPACGRRTAWAANRRCRPSAGCARCRLRSALPASARPAGRSGRRNFIATRPASVSTRRRPCCENRVLPSDCSSRVSWELTVCTARPRRSAARVMPPSLATTQK
jgi:hypothetical protein